MNAILEIEGLKKYYGRAGNQTKALDGIALQVTDGEFLGIMGSSGSGKSTLLNCIATVIRPTAGKIVMQGEEIQSMKGRKLSEYRGKKIGYLFQNFELLDNLTGRENIMLPMSLHNIPDRESKNGSPGWRGIWRSQMFSISSRPRCQAARNREWRQPGRLSWIRA